MGPQVSDRDAFERLYKGRLETIIPLAARAGWLPPVYMTVSEWEQGVEILSAVNSENMRELESACFEAFKSIALRIDYTVRTEALFSQVNSLSIYREIFQESMFCMYRGKFSVASLGLSNLIEGLIRIICDGEWRYKDVSRRLSELEFVHLEVRGDCYRNAIAEFLKNFYFVNTDSLDMTYTPVNRHNMAHGSFANSHYELKDAIRMSLCVENLVYTLMCSQGNYVTLPEFKIAQKKFKSELIAAASCYVTEGGKF